MKLKVRIGKLILDEIGTEEVLRIKEEFIFPESMFDRKTLKSFDLKELGILNQERMIYNELEVEPKTIYSALSQIYDNEAHLFEDEEGFIEAIKTDGTIGRTSELTPYHVNLIVDIPNSYIEAIKDKTLKGFLGWLKIWGKYCYRNYGRPYISWK